MKAAWESGVGEILDARSHCLQRQGVLIPEAVSGG